MERDLNTLDMFGFGAAPDFLGQIPFVEVSAVGFRREVVCLSGYFGCAHDGLRRVEAMQKELRGFDILVTENWTKRVSLLVVGVKARIISSKIKNAIAEDIPIVRESCFLKGLV